MKIFKLFLFAMSFFMVVTQTVAATEAPNEGQVPPEHRVFYGTSTYYQDSENALAALNSGIEKFTVNFQNKLQDISFKLFGILSIIGLCWSGFKIAMSSGSGSLSEPMTMMFRTIFLMGFVYYLITPDGYNLMVTNTMGGLTEKLSILAMPEGTTSQNGFLNFSHAMMSIFVNNEVSWGDEGFWDIFQYSGMLLLGVILKIIFSIFILLTFIAYLSALVSVAIAFAVGPFFIPFLVLEKTSFLFDGWMKFTIAACLSKVTVYILVGIGLFGFDALVSSNAGLLSKLFLCSALGGMLAFQMLKAPEMAQSLISGGSVSFARFASRAGRAVSNGVSNLAGGLPKASLSPRPAPRPSSSSRSGSGSRPPPSPRSGPRPPPSSGAAPKPTPEPTPKPSASKARRPNMSFNTDMVVKGQREGVTIDQAPQQKPFGEISSNPTPSLPSSKN